MSAELPPSSAATTTRPWPEFFDTNSLSLPVSLSDATTRLNINLTHFRVNYINIFLIIFFLTLSLRPLSLLIIFVTSLAWYFIYFSPQSSPIEILGFVNDDRIIVAVLGVITVLALFFAHAWLNLLLAIVIAAVLVSLHAVFRGSSYGDQDPYGGLLDAESGGYSEF
ncbi:PRA1 family protein D [Beta vulgaris subsp. vulgaris]|uniref:PRA1 family protein D n=1 Tax=Beta vulgaris subsp. vulgaris TaxID=3555 RepID=UPI002036E3F8|nr:PRA1 family protein D [Beta vulgaris subsp. vulgaris]